MLVLLSAGCLFGDDDSEFALDSVMQEDGMYVVTVRDVGDVDGALVDFEYELRNGESELHATGEIAIQDLNGIVVGIESAGTWNAKHSGENDTEPGRRAYDVEHEADTCTADEESDGLFPVVFYDRDRDDRISRGDEFVVRGRGYSRTYEADGTWSLSLVYTPGETVLGTPSGRETVGSVQLEPDSPMRTDGNAPLATFYQESSSDNTTHIKVVKVTDKKELEAFTFFLKDVSGSTWAFGEIANQNLSGEVQGIESEESWDVKYPEGDADLAERAYDVEHENNTCDQDDTTDGVFPVVFYDNDRDDKLTAGDQFTIRGAGYSDDYEAEAGWTFEVQYDLTGDVIGTKQLS